MSNAGGVFRIVLASPGGLEEERSIFDSAVAEINEGIAADRGLILAVTKWETNAYPGLAEDGAQGQIDPTLNIENCDLLVGIFGAHFGTPTKGEQSGTVYEIKKAIAAWEKKKKPQVWVYFKEGLLAPQTLSAFDQYGLVLKFKNDFSTKGLWWPFTSPYEFETLVRQHLRRYIRSNILIEGSSGSKGTANSRKELVHAFRATLRERFSRISIFMAPRDNRDQMERMATGFESLNLTPWQNRRGINKLSAVDLLTPSAQTRRVLICGLPGSGKTTLLRFVAYTMASDFDTVTVPIYLRLKDLDIASGTLQTNLISAIQEQINTYATDLAQTEILVSRDWFLEKNMVLLLDGLDEISGEESALAFSRAVQLLHRAYPRCRILITTRPISLSRDLFPDFDIYELSPLSLNQIQMYVTRWFKGRRKEAKELLEQLRVSARIRSLASNPFLLTMICSTAELSVGVKSISRRSELYSNCTDALLRRVYDQETVSPFERNNSLDSIMQLMKVISLRFFMWQEDGFSGGMVKEIASEHINSFVGVEATHILDDVARKTGLLQRTGQGYTFVHRTLWEYFTALALMDLNRNYVINQGANPVWEEVLRLYAGLLTEKWQVSEYVEQLWLVNRPLALRAASETAFPASEFLKPLIEQSNGNQDRLLLVQALKDSLELLPAVSRNDVLQETLEILLIECQETDCEVIFRAEQILRSEGFDPYETSGVIFRLLDLGKAEERRRSAIRDHDNCFEWIEVGSGTFRMGDNSEPDSSPAHLVQIDSFLMAKHPVTNKLLSTFPFGVRNPHYGNAAGKHPAIGNNWFEAYYFALWLGCRLPTEAEWEFSCRGGRNGSSTQYYFGDDPSELKNHAWYGDAEGRFCHAVTETNPNTGREHLNQLGLANMLGNVREWCLDWYAPYDIANVDEVSMNPKGPPTGDSRVVRGGSFSNSARGCRCSHRNGSVPSFRNYNLGFRLVSPTPKRI